MSPDCYDLAVEPWIPTTRTGTGPVLVGLVGALTVAHELGVPALSSPPATSMLLRVLTAIAYRLTGLDAQPPGGAVEWQDRQAAALDAGRFDPDAITAYFGRHTGAFGLFDPARPFLQDPRLLTETPKAIGVNKFVSGRSSGNNPVWYAAFDDGNQVPVSAALAAADLLVWTGYGPGGANSTRTHVSGSGTTTSDHYAKPGPLRGTVSYHPVGRSLFHTLVGGMVPPSVAVDGPGDPALDLCPWETGLHDPTRQQAPSGPRSVLTGRSQHGLLLTPDPTGRFAVDARITWGRKGEQVPALDPYLRHNEEGRPEDADSKRALWRDLDALLGGVSGQDRPLAVAGAEALPDRHREGFTVMAFGFEQDRAQTLDRAWWAAATPPVLAYTIEADPAAYALVRQALDAAAGGRKMLSTALFLAGKDQKQKAANAHVLADAERRYWAAAAGVFDRYLTDGLTGNPARGFALTAQDVYDTVTARGGSARHTWAVAKHRTRIVVPPAVRPHNTLVLAGVPSPDLQENT